MFHPRSRFHFTLLPFMALAATFASAGAAGARPRRTARAAAVAVAGAKPAGVAPALPCYSTAGGCVTLPPNESVDTNSDQTLTGSKRFTGVIRGELTGAAVGTTELLGEFTGAAAGATRALRVTAVPAAALPSIGIGPAAGVHFKHVNAAADPLDPRMDGSLAHPYQNLTAAAAGARDGDHFLITGPVTGIAYFAAGVSLAGAGGDQTLLDAVIVFTGGAPSSLSDLRISCANNTECVRNESAAALTLSGVDIRQGANGAAASSGSGPVVAVGSAFRSAGPGATLVLQQAAGGTSSLVDSRVLNTGTGSGLSALSGQVTLARSEFSVAGDEPAIAINGVKFFVAEGLAVNAPQRALGIVNCAAVRVRASLISTGFTAVVAPVSISNESPSPLGAVVAPGAPQLLFTGNVFATEFASVFQCGAGATIWTRGNFIPGHPEVVIGADGASGCQMVGFAGI